MSTKPSSTKPSPRHPRSPMKRPRRSFTLIEIILATMLGSMVIAGAASVIAMLNRSDSMLRDRFDQTNDLAKAQLVFRRIFSTVVMSNEQKPVGYSTAGTRAMSEQVRAAAAARLAEGNADLPTPRFIVTQNESRPAPASPLSIASGESFPNQRLEIVVSQPPLVSSLAPREILENRDSGNIVRGALELRPSRTRSGKPCSAVWWIPLIETEEGWIPMRDDRGFTLGDKVIDGVVGIRWTIFDDRQRKSTYSAIWYDELPAYVEVELRTTAGLYANWMFDVGWFVGPDSPASTLPDEPEPVGGNGAGNGAGGGGGGGGNGNGAGGPGGGRGSPTPAGPRTPGPRPSNPQRPAQPTTRPNPPQTGGPG